MRSFVKAGTLFVVLAVTAGIAMAQFAKPEDAITYRKSVMQVIKAHFGPMGGVVKGKMAFDQAAFVKNAEVVAMMSTLPWEASLFPGSDKGNTTLSSKALKDSKGFMAAAGKFEAASQELLAAAKSGDMGTIKKRFGATAQTCGGCHKPYRK